MTRPQKCTTQLQTHYYPNNFVLRTMPNLSNYNISLQTINILGVQITPITVDGLHSQLNHFIQTNDHALVLHVNVHGLNLAYQYPWLRQFLNEAKLVFCDGAGVQLAARLYGQTIPMRITYADWMWQLAEFCEQQRHSMFFLGSRPGVADKAADQLKKRFPNLKIAGVFHGYFCKKPDSDENIAVIEMINQCSPNILVVGFGMPLQERWLLENHERLNANVFLTGGAVFDYISGELRRGPHWLTNRGFEWFARLLIEPKRLWKRYLIGNPLFFWRIMLHRSGFLHLD